MSWVNDLVSGLGIPAGAATLAVAMYAACAAAEKAARPEALKDIGRVLKDPSWSHSVRPSTIIEQAFVWTFGDRHVGWKCMRRSILASLVMSLYVATIFRAVTRSEFQPIMALRMAVFGSPTFPAFEKFAPSPLDAILQILFGFLLMAALPDYMALAKTRWLMRPIGRTSDLSAMLMLVTADAVLSVALSVTFALATFSIASLISFESPSSFAMIVRGYLTGVAMDVETGHRLVQLAEPRRFVSAGEAMAIIHGMIDPLIERGFMPSLLPVFLLSTLFTSVWTILILLSTTVVKLLAPIHRFTSWFFDVDHHPLQAIGIVSGVLVMIGSLIWLIIRAVI
jgi:hypothetical protein